MIRGPIDGKYVELWGIPAWRRKLGIGDESQTLTQRIEIIVAAGAGSVDNANARLAAFSTLEETGYVVQTALSPPAFAGREILGTPNQVDVANGNGIAGNTTLSLPQDIHTGASPEFQTIRPSLLNPEFVTYINAVGELDSTGVTADALNTIGAGIEGYFPHWLGGTGGLSPTSTIFTDGTFTGVGVDVLGTPITPDTPLHVWVQDFNHSTVTDLLKLDHYDPVGMATGGGTGMLFAGSSDTVANRQMARIQTRWTVAADATRAAAMDFQTATAGGTLSTKVTILPDGRVGIGTTTPEAGLHVQGAFPMGYFIVTRTGLNGAGSAGVAEFRSDGKTVNDTINITFSGLDSANNVENYTQIRSRIIDPTSGGEDSELQFFTKLSGALASKVVIDNFGRVGIGNTAPLVKLDVSGSSRITGTSSSSLTGTADPTASTTLIGTGTLFTTELIIGDRITVNGETRTVTAIATDLSLTVDTAFTDTAAAAITKLSAISTWRLSNNTTTAVINDIGRFGLGTTAPLTLFHIRGSFPFLLFEDTSTPSFISYRGDARMFFDSLSTLTISSQLNANKGTAAGDTSRLSLVGSTGHLGVGTSSPTIRLHVAVVDSVTTVTDVARLHHSIAGTPAANFGVALSFTGKSSTTDLMDMARMQVIWTTATHATRTSAIEWQVVTSGAAILTKMALSGLGGLSVGDATNTLPLGVINAVTGYRVNNLAANQQYLRGDGTNFVSSALVITDASGILPMANGGTNKAMVASAGAVAYSDVDSLELTAIGVAGQVLTSQGAGTPTWTTPSSISVPVSIADGGTNNTAFNTNSVIFYDGTSLTDDGAAFTYGAAGDNQLIIARAMGAVSANNIGLAMINTSAAALGAQQWSPPLIFEGQGWDSGGSTSQSVLYRNYVVPVQAATNPTGYWLLERSVDGAAFVELLRADSTGFLRVLKDDIRITQGAYGLHVTNSTPATSSSTLQQWSPPVIYEGQGWKTNATAASQRVQFRNYVAPVIGAAAPTAYFITDYDINASGTFTEALRLDTSGFYRLTKDALGNTTNTGQIGLQLFNNTAATAGLNQNSPVVLFRGFGWKTNAVAASQQVQFRMHVVPVTGGAAPTAMLRIDSEIAGAGSFTQPITISSLGSMSVGAQYEPPFGVLNVQVGFKVGTAATLGQVLRGDGTNFVPATLTSSGDFAHAMLSATHSDTLASAVSRGSLIVGNATPLWAELNIGAAARLLRSDGTDASWAQAVLTTDVTGILPIANGGTNSSSFAVAEGVISYDGTRLVNNAALTYTAALELISLGVSVNGVNAPYAANNLNTGAAAGTGYRVSLSDTSNNIITAGWITWTKEQAWTTTLSTQDCFAEIATILDGVTASALQVRSSGSVICGKDSTGTTRTDDFTYICTSNGPPTGVPTTFGNRVPLTFDPNTDTFYIYRGGWKGVVVL